MAATLDFLLTGKAPFEAARPIRLAASIVGATPVAPRALEPDIPPGLSRTIVKCLRKDPRRRVQSVARLRQRLFPFGSNAVRPAPLDIRFVATALDLSPVTVPALWLPGIADWRVAAVLAAYWLGTEYLSGASPMLPPA